MEFFVIFAGFFGRDVKMRGSFGYARRMRELAFKYARKIYPSTRLGQEFEEVVDAP